MKKLISIFLSIVLCLSFASCNGNSSKTDSSNASYSVSIPTVVQAKYDDLKNIVSQNSLDLKLETIEKLDDTTYTVDISDLNTNKDEAFTLFLYEGEKSYFFSKSSSTSLSIEKLNQILKNLLTATIMANNKSLDLASVQKITQDFLNSYTGEGYSKILTNGDFSYQFIPGVLDSSKYSVHMQHQSEIFKNINKDEYKQIDFSTAKSKMNAGTKFKVTGIVKSFTVSDSYSSANIVLVKIDSNNECAIIYKYQNILADVQEGAKYTFYGTVSEVTKDSLPTLDLKYFEKIS